MAKKTKRILAALLTIVMVVSAFSVSMITASAHPGDHDYKVQTVVLPTCTDEGYTIYVCNKPDCDEPTMRGDIVDKLGHKWKMTAYVDPTCTEWGYRMYTCARCGATKMDQEDLALWAPVGHGEPVWVVTFMPTCTQKGYKVGYCPTCGLVIDRGAIKTTEHDEGVWKVDFEPTADHAGQKTKYCTLCGGAIPGTSEEILMHEHVEGYKAVVQAATCTADGIEGTFCAICGACYETAPIACAGHGDTVTVITTPATCLTDGQSTTYCTVCGTVVATDVVAATGHVEGVWYTATEPTCTTAGKELCTCSICGKRMIPARSRRSVMTTAFWSPPFRRPAPRLAKLPASAPAARL